MIFYMINKGERCWGLDQELPWIIKNIRGEGPAENEQYNTILVTSLKLMARQFMSS